MSHTTDSHVLLLYPNGTHQDENTVLHCRGPFAQYQFCLFPFPVILQNSCSLHLSIMVISLWHIKYLSTTRILHYIIIAPSSHNPLHHLKGYPLTIILPEECWRVSVQHLLGLIIVLLPKNMVDYFIINLIWNGENQRYFIMQKAASIMGKNS